MKLLVICIALSVAVTACAQRLPETSVFVPDANARALVALPNGGLRYANGSGDIVDVNPKGVRSSEPLARAEGTALGLIVGPDGRTYASYRSTDGRLSLAQLAPGPVRLIWQGPVIAGDAIGGAMAFTPTGRLLLAVNAGADSGGRILTFDPDLPPTQQPNVISTGWERLGGVAYTAGGPLWVAGSLPGEESQLVRAGTEGPTGTAADLGKETPQGLTSFGDQELVACEGDGELRRFLLRNAAATPGRVVARDCAGDVIELADGRLAYIAGTSIKVTAQ